MNKEIDSHQVEAEAELKEVNIRELLGTYLYHWPVFILGVVLALSIAFLYLRYTKPIYEVSSTLLIKDQKQDGMSKDILSELDLFGGSKVVENEIEVLQSKTLMATVVKRLNLNITLNARGRVISTDLYLERPVNFQTFEMKEDYFGKEWKLSFPNQSQYILEDPETGRKVSGPLNQLQRNYIGTYK
ncbi:MAG: hypothetical protein EOO92_16650, partial [Pedobacter sp.]